VQVGPNGPVKTIVSGLTFPTGMTVGPDGAFYVSNQGFGFGAGQGQVPPHQALTTTAIPGQPGGGPGSPALSGGWGLPARVLLRPGARGPCGARPSAVPHGPRMAGTRLAVPLDRVRATGLTLGNPSG
jgi:hypothetical protein